MAEVKTLKDRLVGEIKEFQRPQHPIFKDTLLDTQKQIHTFNEIKKRLNRIWRFLFTNESYDTGYIIPQKSTVSLINYEKKIAVVLAVNTSVRNKEVSIERLEKFNEENPGYKLIYAVINGAPEEYNTNNVFCLSGEKVFDFILGSKKTEVLSELKRSIARGMATPIHAVPL